MKTRALNHLMLGRLRALAASATGRRKEFLESVQATLDVTSSKAAFRLAWRLGGRDQELAVPLDRFKFYPTGDSPKKLVAKGVREENWQRAAEVIGQMAELSGCPDLVGQSEHGGGAASRLRRRSARSWGAAIAGAGCAAWIAWADGLTQGLLTGGACACFALFLWQLSRNAPDVEWSVWEFWLAVAGLVVGRAAGGAPGGAFVVIAPLTLLALAEARATLASRAVAWGLAGALIGASGALLGWPLQAAVGLSAAVAAALRMALFRRRAQAFEAICGVAGFAVAHFAAGGTQSARLAGPLGEFAVAVIAFVAVASWLCFFLWWVVGTVNLFFAWTAFASIGCGAATLWLSGSANAAGAGLAGFCGICIVSLRRVYAMGAGSARAAPVRLEWPAEAERE